MFIFPEDAGDWKNMAQNLNFLFLHRVDEKNKSKSCNDLEIFVPGKLPCNQLNGISPHCRGRHCCT